MKNRIKQPAFRQWIEDSLQAGENVLAVSNQGTILHYREDGLDLIVKTAMGRGALRALRQRTLLREYGAYRRMEGLAGVPECYGLVDGRYLVPVPEQLETEEIVFQVSQGRRPLTLVDSGAGRLVEIGRPAERDPGRGNITQKARTHGAVLFNFCL